MGLFLYLIPVAIYLFYKWATANYDFFEKQGIAFVKPLPGLGSNMGIFFKKKPFVQSLMELYNQFEDEKVFGAFEFRRPVVSIRDPKIVKHLAVKDFDHFSDHRVLIKEDIDPLVGKLLTSLTGQKWKDMRATLSPAFTGSKMRQMFDFVSEVGQQSAKAMSEDITKGGENAFEFKALASKFTVDVIASCAFGIEVNSFTNPGNDFYRIAMKIANLNVMRQIAVFFGYMIMPQVMKKLGFYLLDKEMADFFHKATHETMKIREEKGIVRNDMINLLMQARKGQLAHTKEAEEKGAEGFATVQESEVGRAEAKTKFDDMDLTAQCLIFFLAGFDTVATTMSFLAYELMCNPDIQQKLYEEIRDTEKELEGKKISYERLQGMKYLDQVVSETLRKWPVAGATDRQCVKDYDLEFDGKVLHFNKDVNFTIPIWCFHHDPKYFPEPEKFDPERFSEENRGNIDPDTYIPFGIGPRNCIGSRFALMELKTIFYYLLLNFSFEVTGKSTIPFEYEKVPFAMKPLNGVWVGLKPRDQ